METTISLSEKTQHHYQESHFDIYRRFPITLVEGKGAKVYDAEGKEYIDALAGIAVNSVGHCHPLVVEAISQQAARLMHISNLYYNIPQSNLVKLLSKLSGLDRVFICNSGLEANEAAIKLARKVAKEKGRNGKIFSFDNCFHGRSIATASMGKDIYSKDFGPLPEGFAKLPYNQPKALEAITNQDIAVFVECVQGEGGVVPGQRDFFEKLQQKCIETGTLLVVDEIQTGMGRTGKMFAYEHFGLHPDIVTLAKALGGGMPIGAMLAKQEVAEHFKPGDHGTTFGGNPLACAAAIAVINALVEDKLVKKAADMGGYLMSKLDSLAEKYDAIEGVRGIGLMIGVVFDKPCREVAMKLMQHGILVSCTADKVIRLVPPLVISKKEIDSIVEAFDQILDSED
jgi:acetylornithine/N-succinyldiaminopimelate aminotransferase